MQLPLHATAMGKVLLSGMTDDEIAALYPDRQLGRLTETTVTSFDELMEQIRRIRLEGVGYSNGESVFGVRCVAAPVRGASRRIVASLGVSIPDARWEPQLWQRIIESVRQGAEEMSMKLYFVP